MTRERFCANCGTIFDAVDNNDRLCKRCLLKKYRALVVVMGETILETGNSFTNIHE